MGHARHQAAGKRIVWVEPELAPDRSKLDAAEGALADVEGDLTRNLDALAAERVELDRGEAEFRSVSKAQIGSLRKARDAASKDYRRVLPVSGGFAIPV